MIEHETIATTIQKAKEVRPFAERLISLARKGTFQARRQAIAMLGGDRRIVAFEDNDWVEKGTVVGKLFSQIGPRYADRPGGYTRIIRLPKHRLGDNGELALLQLVGKDQRRGKIKPKRKKKASGKAAPKEQAKGQERQVEAT